MSDAIRLYLGAHKTATTHLQGLLMANRAALEEHGTFMSAPRDLRPAWLETFFRAVRVRGRRADGQPRDEDVAALRAPAPARGDWILTDENILGTPRDVLFTHGFYHAAPERMATLAQVFGDRRLEAYFSLRSYDGFFRSMYSEIVRNKGYLPFEEFDAALGRGDWSWLPVVEAMVAGVGERNVTLWDFADFPALLPRLVSLLSGIQDSDAMVAAYAPEPTRPSLSQKTLDLLGDLAPAIGQAEALRLTERLNQHFAVARGHAAAAPYTPEQTAALRARYAADLAEIRRRWPQIRFLERPAEGATARAGAASPRPAAAPANPAPAAAEPAPANLAPAPTAIDGGEAPAEPEPGKPGRGPRAAAEGGDSPPSDTPRKRGPALPRQPA